ncbi:hypothetical protein SEPCBS119000_003367 [Sporothrix epigloea]|uniref:Uncharacterized protein n=1 Tax=Sporothrix epigloea TaxID=1892477 RepID=A0ABP0DL81_9PEZI
MSASQSLQAAQPTFINLPQPPSNPDTPSEMPGTPTSTMTSLSAVSTTAMKDGHRGGHIPPLITVGGASTSSQQRHGHQPNASTTSVEAERADRISRLAGLSGMTTSRPSYAANRGSVTSGSGGTNNLLASGGGASAPIAAGFPGVGGAFMLSGMPVPGPLTPAFFDAQGQPVAITKTSTVGTASATNSISGRTLGDCSTMDGSTMTEDDDMDDDDIRSMGTNYRYSGSTGHGIGGGTDGRDADTMMMDDDNLDTASRSVGGYEYDRISDDGSASLVGFGEGAGSTVSGPIYHRRPMPSTTSSAGAITAHNAMAWATTLERPNSGPGDLAVMGSASGFSTRRDFARSPLEYFRDASGGESSASGNGGVEPEDGRPAGLHDRRDVRLIDGMALDNRRAGRRSHTAHSAADDEAFVDTTRHGPFFLGDNGASTVSPPPPLISPIIQAHSSALRETQQPRSHQQQQQNQYRNFDVDSHDITSGHDHRRYGSGMSREHGAAE